MNDVLLALGFRQRIRRAAGKAIGADDRGVDCSIDPCKYGDGEGCKRMAGLAGRQSRRSAGMSDCA
jgi:hypothetical protein